MSENGPEGINNNPGTQTTEIQGVAAARFKAEPTWKVRN